MDTHKTWIAVLLIAMVVIIVAVDVLFFRNHFWERLLVNVGMVLIFAALYMRYLR